MCGDMGRIQLPYIASDLPNAMNLSLNKCKYFGLCINQCEYIHVWLLRQKREQKPTIYEHKNGKTENVTLNLPLALSLYIFIFIMLHNFKTKAFLIYNLQQTDYIRLFATVER